MTCAYSSYDFLFNTSAQTTVPSRLIHTSGLCKPPLVYCCYLTTPHSFPLQNRLSKQRQDITSIQIGSQADTSTSMFQFRFQTHASHLIPAFQSSCTGHDHHTSSASHIITQGSHHPKSSLQYESLPLISICCYTYTTQELPDFV
jgi:hypothetical protein